MQCTECSLCQEEGNICPEIRPLSHTLNYTKWDTAIDLKGLDIWWACLLVCACMGPWLVAAWAAYTTLPMRNEPNHGLLVSSGASSHMVMLVCQMTRH